MKNFSFFLMLLVAVVFSFTGCNNNDDDLEQEYADYQKKVSEQFTKDTIIIKQYLVDHKITATEHPSGIFYSITKTGNEFHPDDYSLIEVKYKGYLTNDSIFHQTSGDETFSSYLYDLLSGWRIGVPLMGKGGEITLYMPSFYGYGMNDNGTIKANSVLIFDIELVDFK
jgi:FKBP-type peptidyl-prolyl cis-trans isomerase FkpA